MKQDYKIYNLHNKINTDGLVNRLTSNLLILNQAHRVACMANRSRKNSKIGMRTRYGEIYSRIINLKLLDLIIQNCLDYDAKRWLLILFECKLVSEIFKRICRLFHRGITWYI